ncbi:hypothetical protein Tco_0832306 [Tanacetum coccineum]
MTTSKLPSLIGIRSILKGNVPVSMFGILDGVIVPHQVASSGWPFASTVLGQMTYLVASLTPDSARSTSPEGFLALYAVVGCNHCCGVGRRF